MPLNESWTKYLVAAGATAAAGAVLYCLLKAEAEDKRKPVLAQEGKEAQSSAKPKVEDISKETVQKILQEIIKSQDQMKLHMKDLTKTLLKSQISFEQTYKQVKEVQPEDPLEKYGLSMMEFDQILDKYQSDPMVRELIAKIMGAPDPNNTSSETVQEISVKRIIEVHKFMLEELEKLVKTFHSTQNKDNLDMKTVTIAAQAIVGAKIEQQFGITSEDIESAVLLYHTMLATDQDFANINFKIQSAMGELMGQQL